MKNTKYLLGIAVIGLLAATTFTSCKKDEGTADLSISIQMSNSAIPVTKSAIANTLQLVKINFDRMSGFQLLQALNWITRTGQEAL